ncbi:FAD-dependent oxidoreductase [Marinomonas fungiae]|uniref:Pyruvate/2-oxoglutarate dehydrogenase complex, dihydrolipoamide dehydrogenase (E3) component or related enzyme n=1 Tax=Marinomonas fungiae TaxID=1137284 RepID=A0A0K6IMW8_9GAMM|nr:bifunctional TVP38/TMEM64 family protein/FAD-dependent oxidoreductase [Marinomonas fungiae]CUB04448.1 Pyruvate/2-oxoglutarate dehydrogenase complex, dihydrolipoamide dehydrogenase (E3) component or related enzyme [Marinomonas fungiae]
MKKTALAGLLIVAGYLLFSQFHEWLTLDFLQQNLHQFQQWRDQQPLLTTLAFFVLYVLVTALSIPGATLMTLAGGALFGLGWGLAIISFASTLGATIAFIGARYFLRDWAQSRFQQRLQAINQGVTQDGAFYLFTLRLVPVFPFFLINLLMGLTPIKTWTFYWVSQVGMLAGTAVYVNAGTQLAQIDGLSSIVSPSLLLSFALLGIFPWFAKLLLSLIKKRRVYQGLQPPKQFDRNLIVIGGGAAGLVSAYIGATVKAKVTLIEQSHMGGDCLNFGCVPSKALIKSAKVADQMRHAERYGLTSSTPTFSFKHVMARVQNVIMQIEPHDSVERYSKLGVDVRQGHAKLLDPWRVEITDEGGSKHTLTSKSIIIASGARPFVPAIKGLESVPHITSDTLWQTFQKLDAPPKRLLVLGGGPIGCELSQAMQRLGSQVTLIEKSEYLLSKEDTEISILVRQTLEEEGVQVITNTTVECFESIDRVSKAFLKQQDGKKSSIEFDMVLVALGRQARLEGFGLEELGIKTERTIDTNDYLETLYPNILAAGDVAGPYQLTHVAAHQAWYASVNALFGQFKRFKADYRVIPAVTFVDPQVARVGLNEREANVQNIAYEVTTYDISDLDRAITESSAQGLIKVLTVPNKDRILGVTIVAEHAGEMLPEFVLAMKQGLGLNKVLGTIHAYPTWAEANKYAAGEWKKAHAPEWLMPWLERYHAWRRKG